MPEMYSTSKNNYEGRIQELEEELSKTKYNKKTQHHIGMVKAKIAQLREKAQNQQKSGGTGYTIKKSGDATVAMLGFPSVGKSTLLNAITNAKSKIASYDFTTLDVIPGTLNYHGAKIQIFDVPGIVEGAAEGSGRGKQVLAAIRSADLILSVVDVDHPHHYDKIMKEVWDVGIRLNQIPPDVKVIKKGQGGINISKTRKLTKIDPETAKQMVKEMGIHNGDIVIRQDINYDQLIDVIKENRVYLPGITIINKADKNPKKSKKLQQKINADICVSGEKQQNTQQLKELIFKKLNLIKIYLKEAGKDPDYDEPMVIKRGQTVEDVCKKIHKNFVKKFKRAKVWGSSKFPGQAFGLEKELKDEDVVEIHVE